MTTKTAAKKSAPKPSKIAKPAVPLAKRSATGKTQAEALGKLDFKGLAREAADKLKAPTTPPPAPVAPEAAAPAASPAAKPSTKPTKESKAAPRSVVPSDAKLTALFNPEENPARAGTVAWKVRDLYLKCKTVGEWRERVAAADLDRGYLQNDVRRGLIRIG